MWDLWHALADRRKILHGVQTWAEFYNVGPKFREALPKKTLAAKNMPNLARFWTTSNFDDKYLRKRRRYSKSDKYVIYCNWSQVRWKSPVVNFDPVISEN